MALKPQDPSNGFLHDKVVAFINEKMAKHVKGPEFYLENMSLSWEEVEDKMRAILEDSEAPSEAQEACVWGGLALGVRFARRQGHLQGHRVQWLHDFAKLHKSAAHALAANLKQLTEQQEMERQEATLQLRVTQAKLAEVQSERDLLRWKLIRTELRAPQEPAAEGPGLAAARGTGRPAAGEEEVPVAAAGAMGGGGRREEEKDAAGPVTTEELSRSFLQLGSAELKNITSGRQREGDPRFTETAMFSLSGQPQAESSSAPVSPLPVQLPASFTYSYSCPLSLFADTLMPSPPPMLPPPAPPQMFSHCADCDVSLWPDFGVLGVDAQETQKDGDPHQQKKSIAFRRPGDWDCPWCKAVNFTRRESCFRCGRGIWLQSQ